MPFWPSLRTFLLLFITFFFPPQVCLSFYLPLSRFPLLTTFILFSTLPRTSNFSLYLIFLTSLSTRWSCFLTCPAGLFFTSLSSSILYPPMWTALSLLFLTSLLLPFASSQQYTLNLAAYAAFFNSSCTTQLPPLPTYPPSCSPFTSPSLWIPNGYPDVESTVTVNSNDSYITLVVSLYITVFSILIIFQFIPPILMYLLSKKKNCVFY